MFRDCGGIGVIVFLPLVQFEVSVHTTLKRSFISWPGIFKLAKDNVTHLAREPFPAVAERALRMQRCWRTGSYREYFSNSRLRQTKLQNKQTKKKKETRKLPEFEAIVRFRALTLGKLFWSWVT